MFKTIKKYFLAIAAVVGAAIGITLLSPVILLILGIFAFLALYAFYVRLLVRINWIPKGKYMLIVTSESPVWREYFQTNVVQRFQDEAYVLNWSERKKWKGRSIPVQIFNTIIGYYSHTPSVVVFSPWYWPKVFRFWKPFKDYKYGKPEKVEKMLKELEEEVEKCRHKRIWPLGRG